MVLGYTWCWLGSLFGFVMELGSVLRMKLWSSIINYLLLGISNCSLDNFVYGIMSLIAKDLENVLLHTFCYKVYRQIFR
ncbi:hypothetical protein M6B38_101740 [Iris pallida]|uniref:Uncharacterized protein n=1 Tax=Iris pallida TaxID=29817 RepID=A0AAX6ILS2_IRIPA|nr:hypothetical protein M6B38_101740 [Iris pallida]